MNKSNEHKSPDYGGRTGYGIFHFVIRYLGIRPAYMLLAFVVPYYLIFRPAASRSANFYLKRRFPADNFFIRFFRRLKYFYRFGQILIDQAVIGILGEDAADFEFADGAKLLEHINEDDGIILLTSHFGAWQMAMCAMHDFGRLVHFHFQLEDHTKGRHFFDLEGQRERFKIIPPSSFLGGMVEFTNILSSGGSVAIMGDRAWGAKTMKADFFKAPANFPLTPYFLAHATKSRIFMILAVRTGSLSFRIDACELTERLDISAMTREETMKILLERYISILEKHLDESPYMWLNFYDFWSDNEACGHAK